MSKIGTTTGRDAALADGVATGCGYASADDSTARGSALFSAGETNLAETDPELVRFFGDFAFGEARSESGLKGKARYLAVLSALIACRSVVVYKAMLAEALDEGLTPIEAKELSYHAIAYIGMAKAYDLIVATNEVLARRGVALPLEGQATTDPETRFERGLAVQKSIFGSAIDAAYENAPTDQAHIQRFLSANCFGDYYTRGGLDVAQRELVTFCLILSLGGCEPQLMAHVNANLAVGNDRALLVGTVTELAPFIGYPRSLNALRCVTEATSQ